MDRNQLTGIILMLVLLTVYFQFFAPDPPVPETSSPEQEVIAKREVSAANQTANNQPIQEEALAIADEALVDAYGAFANAARGTSKNITIETDDLVITFASKGGKVTEVRLKNHLTYERQPLVLHDQNSTDINLLFSAGNKTINTNDLYFEPSFSSNTKLISGKDSVTLVFAANTTSGGALQKIYKLYGSGYLVGFDLKANRLDIVIDQNDFNYQWSENIKKVERDLTDSRNTATIKYFSIKDDGVDYISETSTDIEEENFTDPLKWFSIKQKFFVSALIADNQFSKGNIKTSIPTDTAVVKNAEVSMSIPVADVKAGTASFQYYFGPNDYNILNDITPGFWKNVSLGWGVFGLVNKYMIIPIFNFIEKYITNYANYGLTIILLVLFIRMLLAPLTYKSHMSMAKMKAMKPELDEIKERHGDDMQKAQAEQMQLYQKVGINPLSGCIPMVLQMPILLAMFYFFPNAIQLRQEAFLWASDLSTYDSILSLPFTIPFYGDHVSLFTLLMTLSTILYTWSNSQVQTVTGPMKSIQYVMPVMFLFFLNNYAAGLTFYYFVSNIASFGQIALFRKFVDDDKIRNKLEENKKKNANKKKSSFQTKLEEAMKASQQKTQKDKPKKK